MDFIEPHAHMVSRTTDDYELMSLAGCRAICEPAFWAGFDRASAQGFADYFDQLTLWEPRRASRYLIDHYCWLCINPKEAEDPIFAAEVISLIPELLNRKNVLGIGEIGLNKNTKNELLVFEQHVEIAKKFNQLILIHTPHLEDKLKGTRIILDSLKNAGVDPNRVIIDHVEEHTAPLVMDAGFWAGMTLYPNSKCTAARAVDILEIYGSEKIWINSACDWGHSDPLSIPKAALEMLRRGHSREFVQNLLFKAPQEFLAQSPHFKRL